MTRPPGKGTRGDLEGVLLASRLTGRVLARWNDIALPDCWMVAGAVAQTYWNGVHDFQLDYGIDDIDLAYFDAADRSESAEVDNQQRTEALFPELGVRMDVKNEARVHLWYGKKFGFEIPPYADMAAAIRSFPTTAGAIGVRLPGGRLEVFAPFGLDDLLSLVVRPNKRQVARQVYEAKAARWAKLWPRLTVVEWDAPAPVAW